MDDGDRETSLEAEVILKKIIEDFEQLDRAIDSAIFLLKSGKGQADDVAALRRAKEAAQQGAALARSKVDPR